MIQRRFQSISVAAVLRKIIDKGGSRKEAIGIIQTKDGGGWNIRGLGEGGRK